MSGFADLLLTHMERAAEHALWRRAFSQALLDPSTTKPGHVGVRNEAMGGPSSGVLPQQPHIIFERLYQGGLIGQRTWDRLLQVYPRLQVRHCMVPAAFICMRVMLLIAPERQHNCLFVHQQLLRLPRHMLHVLLS